MTQIRLFLRLSLLGAAFFWLPDTLIHVIFHDSNLLQVVLVTILSLISIGFGTVFLQHTYYESRFLVPVAVLTGIWLTAGIAMGVNGLFSGAGFAVPNGWTSAFTGMVPPIAFLMSSYDGSFFSLSLATLGLFGVWVWMLFHI